MTRRNSLPMTAEDVEKHNARVRCALRPLSAVTMAARGVLAVDAELRSLGVPMHLLPKPKAPRMNKLEAEWAMILEARKRAGEIVWYGFEAIKLRLADKTFYTPDFAVLALDGKIEIHETKGGFIRDDAAVKLKVAAEHFPFRFYLVRKKSKRDGGGFDIKDVADGL